jgi:hypothetical protein
MPLVNTPLVSIVIPAYNAAEFISDAIASIISQHYRPIEIVVVNDGSIDATVDVVKDSSKSMPDNTELRIINIGENKGAANALNVGFSFAKGDYICWLSADDMFIDKMKIQNQLASMNTKGAYWSYYRDFYLGTNLSVARLMRTSYFPYARLLDPLFLGNPDLRLMMLQFRNPINGSSIMIKKSCIEEYGQFDSQLKNVDADGDLWMRYSALRLKSLAINGAPVFYREHQRQTSRGTRQMIYGKELTRVRILTSLVERGQLKEICNKFTIFFFLLKTTKEYLNTPFTIEYICQYILNNEKSNYLLKGFASKALEAARKRIESLEIDRERFFADVKVLTETREFENFLRLLAVRKI